MVLLHAVKEVDELQSFFTELVKLCLDVDSPGARLDFLACPLTQSPDALEILQILEDLTHVSVSFAFLNCWKLSLNIFINLTFFKKIHLQTLKIK